VTGRNCSWKFGTRRRKQEMDIPVLLAMTAIFLGLMAVVLVVDHR
jgi:hypothetical protein